MILTDLQKEILKRKKDKLKIDIENHKELDKFFNPNFNLDTFDSSNIKDIDKVIERIRKAIDQKEKIVIYSDYDCDGIPGAVVLHDFFEKIETEKRKHGDEDFKIDFINYIPHRHNEGYGINKNAVKKFIDEGYTLMITVDCGITNLEEIKFAEDNNLNVILTDHHLPILDKKGEQILPEAFAILNTKRSDDNYEEKFLCGCATAWKLVNGFLNKYRQEFFIIEGWEKWLLDMVGISTISDMVPLTFENRILAKYGIEVLRKSGRPGLQKILKNAKINQKKISEDDISFGIAPRLNAASRIGDAMNAFYALLKNEESINFAEDLEKYNSERKINTKEAHDEIDYENFKNKKIIFIGNEKWGPGIIGLIASKISEETNKTVFVWGAGDDKEILKGSVRLGNDNLNVVEIMTEAKNILENFGGHEMAGGFAIHKNNLKAFENFLEEYSDKNIFEKIEIQKEENILENSYEDFININIRDITRKLFDEIKIFSPFGVDNEKIIFKIKKESEDIFRLKRFGKKSEHLEINWNGVKGIEFFVNEEREKELLSQKEFLVNVEWDNFRGDVVMRFVK